MRPLDRVPAFTMRQLVAFVAVAEAGTISGAAERLLVSQSAVSMAITELERALQAQLCVRRRAHGVQLTPTGQMMLGRARVLLQQADEMERETTGAGGELSGPLSVGCYPTIGPTVLPPLLREFTGKHPAVHVHFLEAMNDRLAAGLGSGELDAVILYDLWIPESWRTTTLLTRHPALVVHAEHPMAADRGPVDLSAVAEEPMVLLESQPSAEHAMHVCARAGFTPRIGYRSANPETVRALVGHGLGWTIMLAPTRLSRTYGGLETVSRPIGTPELDPVRLVIAWRADVRPSRVVRAFIEHAGRSVRSI
ncbi:LysR family transcriptional regulator [Geodermatophilus sp. URMC 64]